MKWLALLAAIALIAVWAYGALRQTLKPRTVIKQSHATTTHVSYSNKTKHYDEGDFSVDVPTSWHVVSRPPHTYQSFSWQSSDLGTDGQVIEIFEDTIPSRFSVNRVLVVEGNSDRLTLNGTASDNCADFTLPAGGKPQVAALSKWQGVSFLCDQANNERDVIGTSSTDGIDTVILNSQSSGATHKFFFTYTDYSVNPDYTVFYNFLNSFRMN